MSSWPSWTVHASEVSGSAARHGTGAAATAEDVAEQPVKLDDAAAMVAPTP